MLRLVLVRHGQTAANAARRFAGTEDTLLTEAGHAMAEALAVGLAGERFDAIYSSPLQRARDTVVPLAKRLDVAVQTLDGLAEYDCGSWQGRTMAQVEADEPDELVRWLNDPATLGPPGGETGRAVAERALAALVPVFERHVGGRILIASHKGTLRVLLATWLGIPLCDFRRRLDQPLCGITRVDWTDQGALLRTLGDLSHLSGDLRAIAEAG